MANKSKIRKSIIRKIRTADFEQLDVVIDIEEEIEWENQSQRKKKTEKITKLLIDDFRETYNEVCEELKVDRCIGSVSGNIIKENKNKENNDKNGEKEEKDNIDFDSID